MQVSVRNARQSGMASLKEIASEDERFRAETEVGAVTSAVARLLYFPGAQCTLPPLMPQKT